MEQTGCQQTSPPCRPWEAGGGKSVQKQDESEGALAPCRAGCKHIKPTFTAEPLDHQATVLRCCQFPISNGPAVWGGYKCAWPGEGLSVGYLVITLGNPLLLQLYVAWVPLFSG